MKNGLRVSLISRFLISGRKLELVPARCLVSSTASVPLVFQQSSANRTFLKPADRVCAGLVPARLQNTETNDSGPGWNEVTYDELKEMIDKNDVFLIDVREPEEVKEMGKIKGSINIPLGRMVQILKNTTPLDFKQKFGVIKPAKNQSNIVFYGAAKWGLGVKSGAAVQMAHKIGYHRTRHYVGGYTEWHKKERGSHL